MYQAPTNQKFIQSPGERYQQNRQEHEGETDPSILYIFFRSLMVDEGRCAPAAKKMYRHENQDQQRRNKR